MVVVTCGEPDFVDSEEGKFGARWLYGVRGPPASSTNVMFDLGRTSRYLAKGALIEEALGGS